MESVNHLRARMSLDKHMSVQASPSSHSPDESTRNLLGVNVAMKNTTAHAAVGNRSEAVQDGFSPRSG